MSGGCASCFVHAPGPIHAHICDFGTAPAEGAFDGMVCFGGWTPERMPVELQGVVLGQIARRGRLLVVTHSAAQQSWVRAQVALLTAPGGRA